MKIKMTFFKLGSAGFLLLLLHGVVLADPAVQNSKSPEIAKAEKVKPEESLSSERDKNKLLGLVKDIQSQERKVLVLADLYNQELSSLRQKQAYFCDIYKLNLDKFRKGFYSYDEKTGRFVEREARNEEIKAKNSILG